jgi:1,4-dihydroxy-2-naphthoate octaprenyltransferase
MSRFEDVNISRHRNRKPVMVSIALIVIAGIVSLLPIYGWLLTIVVGIVAVLIPIKYPYEQIELEKTRSTGFGVGMLLVKKEDSDAS